MLRKVKEKENIIYLIYLYKLRIKLENKNKTFNHF